MRESVCTSLCKLGEGAEGKRIGSRHHTQCKPDMGLGA